MQDFSTFKGTRVNYGSHRRGVKLVFGFGLNDASYDVYTKTPSGKYKICPVYAKWKKMLERVYYSQCHKRQPTYKGVSVNSEWLCFSNFSRWMLDQDWVGRELDKDLLGDGTLYSPDTCCFMLDATNNFLKQPKKNGVDRGLPVGVTVGYTRKGVIRYRATVSNSLKKKTEHIGTFDSPEEASQAYLERKSEIAYELSKMEPDPRVVKALLSRYQNETKT